MEDNMKNNSTEKTENIIDISDKSKLDSLRFDEDDGTSSIESPEEAAKFAAFMKNYHELIGRGEGSNSSEEITEADENEFLISQPRRGVRRSAKPLAKKENREDWNDDITLAPQDYVDPGEEDKIMVEQLPEEDPTPDFNLGEPISQGDDKFQLSINFTGETAKETNDEPEERKYDPDKPRIIDWIFEFAEMIVFVLLAVMMINAFLFKHAVVEGPSMNNTLADGDHLIISDIFYTPERGDIIVFEDYSTILKKPVVKRVIGLPNDTVEVKLNDNGDVIVYVNGELLDEDYALNSKDSLTLTGMKVTVGEDEVFVMGDNRYHSTDSRDPGVGTIKIDSILGKVLFRFYPFDKFGAVE